MRLGLHDLRRLAGERKLATLTSYEASLSSVIDRAGVDIILVGDSLGMVIQGHDSTLPVSIHDMVYHTRAVVRGSARAFIVADMPFGSYQSSHAQALDNAVLLMQAGAQMVKLEGGTQMAETVSFLVQRGIPVCGHIGLTPQHVHAFGGFRVQGRGDAAASVLEAARAIEAAGAAMTVIEGVPEALATRICEQSGNLTIGIGASAACHGQVLVIHDLLGISQGKRPRFVKNFLDGSPGQQTVEQAILAYVAAVQHGRFPGPEHTYSD
jgi:3-methyl-2-oxobutanoate hydroxymethyltransferase